MIDNSESSAIPLDNIRTLLTTLAAEIDRRLARFRSGTRYENVRPSDVRVFVAASRGNRSIADIARSLDVSRQAVHASVQRLAQLKIVELQAMPHNQRDKIVAVTARGEHARAAGVEQVRRLESEFAAAIGGQGLEALRRSLAALVANTASRNAAEPPPAIEPD